MLSLVYSFITYNQIHQLYLPICHRQVGTQLFTFDYSQGDFTATGDLDGQSDARLKQNVETIEGALDKVTQLRGVYFERISHPDVRKVGVIAQEVEAIVPELVKTDEEGIKSVSYGNITGLLIEAIKDLNKKVDDLA